jgi:hypothetical protein
MVTDEQKKDITEMLKLAIEINDLVNSAVDSGCCDALDDLTHDERSIRLEKLKAIYTEQG